MKMVMLLKMKPENRYVKTDKALNKIWKMHKIGFVEFCTPSLLNKTDFKDSWGYWVCASLFMAWFCPFWASSSIGIWFY